MASVEQRGDSYRVVWRYEGRKQYTTWPSEAYAEEARAIVEGHRGKVTAERVYIDMKVLDPTDVEPAGLTFREWCEQWLPSKTRISPGTRARYEQQLRDELLPRFGDDPMGQINAVNIGTWINQMRTTRSTKTVTRYYSLLYTALQAAVDHGHIQLNPCKGVDFVRDQRADDDTGEHKAVYLTPQQYELLRSQFSRQWHPLLDCFIETGGRWGEVTALAKKHLVPPSEGKSARVRVWRAWKEDAEGRRYLGTTKGRSKRSVPIGTELYRTLAALVEGKPDDTLLFRTDGGEPLDYDQMYDQVWMPALLRARRCPDHPPANRGALVSGAAGRCRDYGGVRGDSEPCGSRVVPGTNRCAQHFGPAAGAASECGCPGVLRSDPSWHDLRHTFASWCFSDPRMTVLAISRLLGHQQLATTSEIYGDLMPEAEETVVLAIADARRSARTEPTPVSTNGERRRVVRRVPSGRMTRRRRVLRLAS